MPKNHPHGVEVNIPVNHFTGRAVPQVVEVQPVHPDSGASLTKVGACPAVLRLPVVGAAPKTWVMVFDSDTVPGSFVVVTSEMVRGAPLIVAISPDESTGGKAFNFVPSLYPKEDLRSVQRWLNDGKLRYLDKKQSPQWFGSTRLQLPGEIRTTKGLQGGSVATEDDVGKAPDGPVFSVAPPTESATEGRETPTTPLNGAVTVNVGGRLRPALNSNGQPIHWSVEGVRNFWRWFGDSKVVDAEGKPLVVHHGTKANFSTFSLEKFGQTDGGWAGEGFYFAPDPAEASVYATSIVGPDLFISGGNGG